jgi:hypothetical protein
MQNGYQLRLSPACPASVIYHTTAYSGKRFPRYAEIGSDHIYRKALMQFRKAPDELPVSFFRLMAEHHIYPVTAYTAVIRYNFSI